MNPIAMMREPFDVEEHQRSRCVCEPLHLLDYCLINDGAACVIVATAERARDCKKKPVYISGMQALPGSRDDSSGPIRGSAWRSSRYSITSRNRNRSTKWRGLRLPRWTRSSPTTLSRSSHGSRSSGWGFCKPGEAPAFTAGGRIEVGGALPMNTNGRLLSEAHVMGWNHQVEIVRQLRGECGPRQVAGARVIQWANAYGDSLIYHT